MSSSAFKPWLALAALCATVAAAPETKAAAPNYVELFRTRVIKCIHPTVNIDKATVEITKGPDTSGDVTTVRFKTFYEGMVRKNAMETEMMIRQAGSIRQMRINTLSDTGSGGGRCNLEKAWADF